MELKVIAKRKPGFTAPIAIALPWNPPGISSQREAVIAENQDEATILLNASGGAPLNTWKIVVNGTYTEMPPGPPPSGRGRRRRLRAAGYGLVRAHEADGRASVPDPQVQRR